MKISVLTLFTGMFDSCKESIIKRAIDTNKLELEILDIRDFSADKHKKCDDTPYGGGAGMVMTPQPLADCIKHVDPEHKAHRIYLSPKGETLNQTLVKQLSDYTHLVLICGHYEGIDQRIIDNYIDREVSIGDYVLTGGELAAQVVIDCVARYIPGVLGNSQATLEESFSNGLLEYPQYTKPAVFEGVSVPEVLLSGHHSNIEKWRKEQSIEITKAKRKDLL